MAMNYARFGPQWGALLKNSGKYAALIQHLLRSDVATYNAGLLAAVIDQTISAEKSFYNDEVDFFVGTALNNMRNTFKSARSQAQSFDDFFGLIATGLGLSNIQTVQGGINYIYDTTLLDGTIMIADWQGPLGYLHRDMLQTATYVKPCTMTPGSFTAFQANKGVLAKTSLTALSQIPDQSRIFFKCVNANTSAPQLQVYSQLAKTLAWPDGTTYFTARNNLTCEKVYNDGLLGLSTVVLTRPGIASPVLSGDPFTLFTLVSFTNPQESDMNGGVLQTRVTRQGTVGQEWLIEFFSSSARTNKVGAVVIGGTSGTFAVTNLPMRSGTIVNFTFDRTKAQTNYGTPGNLLDTVAWNIQTPQLGDYWYLDITNGKDGNFAWQTGLIWQWTPPTAGTTLITDAGAAPVSVILT